MTLSALVDKYKWKKRNISSTANAEKPTAYTNTTRAGRDYSATLWVTGDQSERRNAFSRENGFIFFFLFQFPYWSLESIKR
jgi:hypothetical protein